MPKCSFAPLSFYFFLLILMFSIFREFIEMPGNSLLLFSFKNKILKTDWERFYGKNLLASHWVSSLGSDLSFLGKAMLVIHNLLTFRYYSLSCSLTS